MYQNYGRSLLWFPQYTVETTTNILDLE